jgi:hypothetical protein
MNRRIAACVACGLAAALAVGLLAGCGGEPTAGKPKTKEKALDGVLRTLWFVRTLVQQRNFDTAGEQAADAAIRLDNALLNDVPGIAQLRADCRKLRQDLQTPTPPEDVAARLDALIERVRPLAPAADQEGQPG